MKAVILAGGLGSRLSEETSLRPKPMTEVGGRPLLWHIMKIYSHHGINEFIICLGYKGYVIKEYFSNYFLHSSNVTIDLTKNSVEIHENYAEPWRITLVDTGQNAMTGGRLKAIRPYLGDDESFCFTYGDGVSDLNIRDLIAFHKSHGKLATVTAVSPPGRFGALEFDGDMVIDFREKPAGDGGRINGGFFVASPSVLDFIAGPETSWEREPMERLAHSGQLAAFQHDGFWHSVDTLRDKTSLEEMWSSDRAPWKVW
jgi:glucose-1-phosphate cytidylyltransferase